MRGKYNITFLEKGAQTLQKLLDNIKLTLESNMKLVVSLSGLLYSREFIWILFLTSSCKFKAILDLKKTFNGEANTVRSCRPTQKINLSVYARTNKQRD